MTFKQNLFINKYLNYRNATKAVLEVYDVRNRNSAAVIGCRLLRNTNVKSEINRILEAEESIPSQIVILINNVLNYGSTREQLSVINVVLKLYGIL